MCEDCETKLNENLKTCVDCLSDLDDGHSSYKDVMILKEFHDYIGTKLEEHGNKKIYIIDLIWPEAKKLLFKITDDDENEVNITCF